MKISPLWNKDIIEVEAFTKQNEMIIELIKHQNWDSQEAMLVAI